MVTGCGGTLRITHVSSSIRIISIEITFYFSALGAEAKKYMEQGKFVPDEVMVKFILNEIRQCKSDSWLLDGKYHIIMLGTC